MQMNAANRQWRPAPSDARWVSRASLRGGAPIANIDHPITAVAVMVGLLVAIQLLPADVQARDALRMPALVFALSLCAVPVLTAFRDPRSVLRAEHILLLAPIYWILLDPLQGRYGMGAVDQEAVRRSFLAIALFVAAALVAFLQRPWRMPRFVWSAACVELPTQMCFGIGIMAFALAFLKYAVPTNFNVAVMAQTILGGRFDSPWARGDLGGVDAFLDHLSYFGYLLPPLTVVLARRIGWTHLWTITLGICALILSAFLVQTGGRRLVGMFVGSGCVFWFLGKPRVRPTTVLTLVAVTIGLLFSLDQMLKFRIVGAGAFFGEDSQANATSDETDVLVRVDDNFLRLAQTTAIFPELHPYTTWRYVLFIAVRPVPRLFWSGKPVNAGFDLAQAVGVRGASLSSSVIGELFMAGGFIAVALGGWFYGRLARSLSNLLAMARTSSALLIYSSGLFALFIGIRSMIELVLSSYVILAWVGLVNLHQGFRGSGRR